MAHPLAARIGRFGLWAGHYVLPDDAPGLREVGAHLDRLNVGSFWLGGSPPADLGIANQLLAGSAEVVVGTSILNIWTDSPTEAAASTTRLRGVYGDRFVLGIGVGHAPHTEEYRKPMAKLAGFLDELDAAAPPVPVSGRVIAALGPKALELTRDRAAGSIPYLTTPDHTAEARKVLGPDALLIPEHKVVLSADADKARAIGRDTLAHYLLLPNYVNNWRRLGFTEDDFAGGGSDRLVDAVIAHGDLDTVVAAISKHLEAGADSVAIQALVPDGESVTQQWEKLAPVFSA
jgi:probable F420-dependent oxidoreductase